ncbi:MAG: UTP--glucose-1-phosphate uridylyltransferase, partial [Leptospiraceae bacterium]|nr:UTP--glucose-1-phosphate uridylyltransferase [Leptospiraceae bacterium]
LEKLIEQVYEYAFLSNGDSLGAVVDGRIITMMARQSIVFAMEVTPKTKADIKGGVLYREKNGAQRIQLLETAQVPEGHMPDFEDINRFEFFSINNLWVRLPALKERLRQGPLSLSLIVNPKEVGGKKVLQLECAMGSGIGQFDKTKVIEVPRSRFAPVKKCDDLLVRRSDAYILDENKALVKNPQGRGVEPVVKLSDDYKKVADFERLVQEVPSILELEELVVEGPVLFDIPVTLKGKVKFIAQNGTAKISKLGKTSFENETLQL